MSSAASAPRVIVSRSGPWGTNAGSMWNRRRQSTLMSATEVRELVSSATARIDRSGTRVKSATDRTGPPVLDETDQVILDALAGGAGRLTSEIAGAIDLTPRATRTRLARLGGRGLVREIGTGPQDPKRRYFRAE